MRADMRGYMRADRRNRYMRRADMRGYALHLFEVSPSAYEPDPPSQYYHPLLPFLSNLGGGGPGGGGHRGHHPQLGSPGLPC